MTDLMGKKKKNGNHGFCHFTRESMLQTLRVGGQCSSVLVVCVLTKSHPYPIFSCHIFPTEKSFNSRRIFLHGIHVINIHVMHSCNKQI